MKSALDIRNPYRRADGHVGARAVVSIEHPDGWHQRYAFDTHGMTSKQVAAKTKEIEEYHATKAARLTGFRSIQGAEFWVNGKQYRVVDCTIFDRHVTLYLDARRIAEDGTLENVEGFPVRLIYNDVDKVPSNGEIVAIVIGRLGEIVDVDAAHEEFVAKVAALRGDK